MLTDVLTPPLTVLQKQNDAFRTRTGDDIPKGQFVTTQGINALGDTAPIDIIAKVAAFDDFGPDNDPHHEHDFGTFPFIVDGEEHQINWKIDYYDNALEYGSENPEDLRETRRVMTVYLAEEH